LRTPEQFRCNSYGRGNQVQMHAAGKNNQSLHNKEFLQIGTHKVLRSRFRELLVANRRKHWNGQCSWALGGRHERDQVGMTCRNWTSTCHNLCHLSSLRDSYTLESCDNITKIRVLCNKNDSPNSGVHQRSCSWNAAQRLHFYHRGMN